MAEPPLGGILRACRGRVTTQQLADCMFYKEHFAPSDVNTSGDLEQRLNDIEAGRPWPFSADDVKPFLDAVINCLPDVPPDVAQMLTFVGARLYLYLFGLGADAGP